MKKQRNDCEFCENFIEPVFENAYKLISNAKCKLGKIVRFQIPKRNNDYQGGYFTHCKSYKLLK